MSTCPITGLCSLAVGRGWLLVSTRPLVVGATCTESCSVPVTCRSSTTSNRLLHTASPYDERGKVPRNKDDRKSINNSFTVHLNKMSQVG